MSGRRVAGGRGRTGLEELVRVACSTDPLDPVIRPRRLALAPRAAMVFGALLLVLGLGLALRAVLTAPDGASGAASPTATGLPAAAVDPAATGPPGSAAAPGPADPAATGPGSADPAGAPAGRIVVHVVGAVVSPGVVVLADGARVADAIAAAGGAASDADTEQLNLARVLGDGEQVRVPHAGEQLVAPDPGPSPPGGASGGGAAGASGGSTPGGGVVNINTAGAAELEALPGIGPALAARIVEYRDGHGPFASVDDLTDVPGIGPAKLEALRSQATV